MSKKNGPEPFYRPKKKRWYVEIDGKHINLGAEETIARQRWHQIMSGAVPVHGAVKPTAEGPRLLVCSVIDLFLDWCIKHRSKRTAEWYQDHLQSFLDSLPDAATMPTSGLKPFHVVNWTDAHGTWGPMHRRGAITAVQRAFNWAEKIGHIPTSPVRGVEKPPAKRREQVLTIEEFADLLKRVKEPRFRDVLEFCWETGCRVQEVRLIQSRHVRLDRGRIELPPEETKGKKRWRIIHLTERAETIIHRLLVQHPYGWLFRNAAGKQWEAQNFNNRFCRLQHRLGREILKRHGFQLDAKTVEEFARTLNPRKMEAGRTVTKTDSELIREARKKLTIQRAAKLGTKYALTAIRHSFATRLLEAGVDHLTVSALLGHADGSMVLSRTYSHLGEKTDFLREALLKAARGHASGEVAAA
jgi:integrase